jgi:hypothetical protein
MVYYFARHTNEFDIQINDLYPRNGAGFLEREASYYEQTYLETPLRTTLSPFGMPGDQITVRSGIDEMMPYDRTVPADGMKDFNDLATGDVTRASIVEGPLSGYKSLSGGLAMLYLDPFRIPQEQAESSFLAQRGAYGYAYTRGRVARMFTKDLGFAFSTDYREGDGLTANTDDDSYNIKTRIFRRINRRTTLDAGLAVYRREGGFEEYQRRRRDQQWTLSLTRQEFYGGQLTGRYKLDMSRSEDAVKVIRPRDTYAEVTYLLPHGEALYQTTLRFGKEQYYIKQYYASRHYGFADVSGFLNLARGTIFLFGRAGRAENQDAAFEWAAGYTRALDDQWRLIVSAGYLQRWPDLTDLYLSPTSWDDDLSEQGNLDLLAEKKVGGNAVLFYTAEKFDLSVSVNAGWADDLIYYDRNYDAYPDVVITPENDNVTFADVNLSGNFRKLWWLFGKGSATARKVDSDRYGDNMPYSPRWQVYGMLGLEYYVEHYLVNIRLFGDMTYAESPLDYLMQELNTTAVFNWGFNASLKDATFFYRMENASNQYQERPSGYAHAGWYYSWGFAWKFLD